MNEIGKKFLPLGTVVLLKNAKKPILITGFVVMGKNRVLYDYAALPYPEGLISSDFSFLFNHEQIDKVLYKGYVDDTEISFKKLLNESIDKKDYEEFKKKSAENIKKEDNIKPSEAIAQMASKFDDNADK